MASEPSGASAPPSAAAGDDTEGQGGPHPHPGDGPHGDAHVVARVTPPHRQRGSWVAKILVSTTARPSPGGRGVVARLRPVADYGLPHELLVLEGATTGGDTGWVRVRLPGRPNAASGWLPAADVRLRRTADWVQVRTTARTVTLYRHGRARMRVRAVVGSATTPTPHGLFAVWLSVPQRRPQGFLGPWALHLTAHSDVLVNYGGGPGRVAIHGRAGASLADPLGSARSHGCIRIDNGPVTRLARMLRPGTPVQIVR